MASSITPILKGINVTCDVIRFMEHLVKANSQKTDPDTKSLMGAIATSDGVCIGFALAELSFIVSGSSNDSLAVLKFFECLPRFASAGMRFTHEVTLLNQRGLKGVPSFVQKGIVAPLSDVARVCCEQTSYLHKSYLDQLAKDPNATLPILEYDPATESFIEVGRKPIVKEECLQTIEKCDTLFAQFSLARLVTEPPFIDQLSSLYEQLTQVREEKGPLLDLDHIPKPLYTDIVFCRYICSISNKPIRSVVIDKENNLYDEKEISERIAQNTTTVTKGQLKKSSAIQLLINDRLKFHEKQLEIYLSESRTLKRALNIQERV